MNKYMKIAKGMAEDNLDTNAGGPFGACIVKEGRVVGVGSNNVISTNDPTAHAEIVAIRDACKNLATYDLSGCEIYATCYPCPMCLSSIIWSNIKKVYYGNTKEDAANIGFRDDFMYKFIHDLVEDRDNKEVLDLENINRDETIETFEKFNNKEDKIIY